MINDKKVNIFIEAIQKCLNAEDIPENKVLTELSSHVAAIGFLLQSYTPKSQKKLIMTLHSMNLLRPTQIKALIKLLKLENI